MNLLIASAVLAVVLVQSAPYPWLKVRDVQDSVTARIAPPSGFEREPAPPGSFAEWLRNLPLKKGRPEVRLYDGRLKSNQEAHVAVLDIDTGTRDLQQCADAVIRLRAEYLFSREKLADIHFNFTSGEAAHFAKWSEGFRPNVTGKSVRWAKTARPDDSYASFREYLNIVFAYAGSASLNQEMQRRTDVLDVRAGDVFIEGGYPGHAVIVVDAAREARTGRRVFLLAQSFMPAQEIHILKNPAGGPLGPWYDANIGQTLKTPEWTFRAEHLKRFSD